MCAEKAPLEIETSPLGVNFLYPQLGHTSLLALLKAQLSRFIHSVFPFSQVCDVLTAEMTQLRWEDREMFSLFAHFLKTVGNSR